MSTTRRRKADAQPTSPTKKVKKDPDASTSNGCVDPPRWEYEAGKNKWTKYTDAQSKEISEALKAGKATVEVDQGKSTVMVNFEQMVQRNTKTGFEKRVRCLSPADNNNEYVWQLNESKDKWSTYPQCTISLLEAGKALGMPTVSWSDQGKQITVDLNKCTQSKSGNKTSKKVRRIQADSADPPPVQKPSTSIAKTKPAAAPKVKAEPPPSKKTKKEKDNVSADEEKEPAKMKSLVFTGKAPVDSYCPIKDKTHVFYEGPCIWDTMLNQTNVQNNNNKYYLIQLLEDNVAKKYYVWMRWGRVGFAGQNNLETCGADLGQAKKIFKKKFSDKTKNDWEDRDCFEKVPGKYDLLIMDYKANGDEVDAPKVKEEKPAAQPSKLDSRIQTLIELICNVQAMEDMLKEMQYDVNKAPLGKLTTEQIKAGYEALKNIESCINDNNFGQKLVKACNEFYTRIPHCFGMKRPPLISTKEQVKIKIQLLEALGDIQIAVTMLKEELIDSEHPLDRHYKSLHCDLTPLDHEHDDFKMVEQYLQNTHAKTHNQYAMDVVDVFDVKHQKESFRDVGNRMLLWHGSRLTNWAGILSQGLRIAPPEAPVTGYMFGKGIYFADMSSKSANYCFASRSKNTGILLLSEVSLGKSNELLAANYNADKLPDDCHSVKALGKVAPDPVETVTRPDGLIVPLGKGIDTNVNNPNGYTLNYNEYIVYNTDQVRMRYLVKVKFNFK